MIIRFGCLTDGVFCNLLDEEKKIARRWKVLIKSHRYIHTLAKSKCNDSSESIQISNRHVSVFSWLSYFSIYFWQSQIIYIQQNSYRRAWWIIEKTENIRQMNIIECDITNIWKSLRFKWSNELAQKNALFFFIIFFV